MQQDQISVLLNAPKQTKLTISYRFILQTLTIGSGISGNLLKIPTPELSNPSYHLEIKQASLLLYQAVIYYFTSESQQAAVHMLAIRSMELNQFLVMTDWQANQTTLCQTTAQALLETSFHYQMTNMKALKIVALIKFGKLDYELEEVTDEEDRPYLLSTPQGELYDEYQIVSYIVNDSANTSRLQKTKGTNNQDGTNTQQGRQRSLESGLCGKNAFVQAKMTEQLFRLRSTLFPLLSQFSKYILGHESVKKSKYETLNCRIRKQIMNLDQFMGEHPETFSSDDGFLNIIIACELFIGCKFAFEEKFRKSKSLLFDLCERISKRPEFEEVYGKGFFCGQEGLAIDFESEDVLEPKRAEGSIGQQMMNLMETSLEVGEGKKRNQLLYNFFRNTLKGKSSKVSYFPYYWLMYDNLACTLVKLHYCFPNKPSTKESEETVDRITNGLANFIKTKIDYGFIGVYLLENGQYEMEGLICLGSMQFGEFKRYMDLKVQLPDLRVTQLEVECAETKRKIEDLWENQIEGCSFAGRKVCLLRGL